MTAETRVLTVLRRHKKRFGDNPTVTIKKTDDGKVEIEVTYGGRRFFIVDYLEAVTGK